MTNLRKTIARAVADQLFDGFDNAFVTKSEWNAARGEKAGRVRDINEPMQDDYLAAADAALAAIEAAGFVVKRRDAIEDMEATLEAYVSDFCEGFGAEYDLDYADSVMLNDCSGCQARVALAKAAKP